MAGQFAALQAALRALGKQQAVRRATGRPLIDYFGERKPRSRRADTPSPTFKFNIEKGKKYERLEKEVLTDPAQTLNIIGSYIVQRTRSRFYQQRWRARAVPNIAGVINDLRFGTHVKPSRFRSRPALVDTGRLRDSFTHKTQPPSGVVVESSAPYASLHHRGGRATVEVTSAVKANLSRKQAPFRKQFAWLLNRSEVGIQVPSRRLVRFTPADVKQVNKIIVQVAERRRKAAVEAIFGGS